MISNPRHVIDHLWNAFESAPNSWGSPDVRWTEAEEEINRLWLASATPWGE